jgi:hypothetical protein
MTQGIDHEYKTLQLTAMPADLVEAPESTLPYPPIHTDKKFVVLSDWFVAPSFLLFIPHSSRSPDPIFLPFNNAPDFS